MNKILVKVIKRKDAEIMVNTKAQSAGETEHTAPLNKETTERHSRRKIVATVSTWISERRENNRIERNAAIRRIFANESMLSEI